MLFPPPFSLLLVFHGRGNPCQSPAVVSEHSTVTFPFISLLHLRNVLMETFSLFVTYCTTILRGENPNASEGSVFLVTCCSLISGSSAKGCLEAPHSFEPISQKYFYYKFKTFPSRLFITLKELVEVFVLDKVSYLWTNENTSFQFCLT